jgi:glycosyltransferase involved in cell wall biosynthesis
MKLIYVPIEPLSERYTEQWYKHFPTEFAAAGFDVTVIDGKPLQSVVKVGTFLDINSTIHYKSIQMARIAELFDAQLVEAGTVFFFGDIEFWGIEAVRLMADMNGIKVKLCGFLHAASYTIGDAFEIAAPYQRYTELGWFKAFDKIFVGSAYHKRAVITRRLRLLENYSEHSEVSDKIIVSGNPLFESTYDVFPNAVKRDQIVLTNRFDKEKSPDQTLELFKILKSAHPDWTFIVATGRSEFRSNDEELLKLAQNLEQAGVIEIRAGLTKYEYHKLLSESKIMVSHSPEENFGYCIAEAAHYKCAPLLHYGASHPELVDKRSEYLFTSQEEAISKAEILMSSPELQERAASLIASYFTKPLEIIIENLNVTT